jgi:hypothetical protein
MNVQADCVSLSEFSIMLLFCVFVLNILHLQDTIQALLSFPLRMTFLDEDVSCLKSVCFVVLPVLQLEFDIEGPVEETGPLNL